METKEEDYETAVLIKNIQNKKYVLDYGYKFFASKGLGKSYRLKNTKTEINFIVHNSEIAYELMKKFEECKRTDKALDGIEVQLTMIPKGEHPETYFNTISKKNDQNNKKEHKMSSALKASIQKDEEIRNIPYFQRHTQDICNREGIVASDSPYISKEEIMRKEEKESRKKDISNKKFSSVLPKYPHNNNEGLDIVPIGNIEGFKFRDEDKKKWISKRGFQVY